MAFKLDSFAVALVIISVFFIGGALVFGNTISNYNINTTTSDAGFTNVYDTINDTYELSEDIHGQTVEGDIEGADESWDSMIKGVYSSLRLFMRTPTLARQIMQGIAGTVGIPEFFVWAFMAVISVLVVFAIAKMVFRVGG